MLTSPSKFQGNAFKRTFFWKNIFKHLRILLKYSNVVTYLPREVNHHFDWILFFDFFISKYIFSVRRAYLYHGKSGMLISNYLDIILHSCAVNCQLALLLVLRWRFAGVAALTLRGCCYDGATLLLRWCYASATRVLIWCYAGSTLMLSWYYASVS